MSDLRRTPLYGLHASLEARFVPFAGWEMPVQFAAGVMKEHQHTREAAGLFDVSHMGQVILRPDSGDAADAARALEALVPADILGLGAGRQRYALFTSAEGGILDDLMVANRGDHLFLVVNAARADHDIAHLQDGMTGKGVTVEPVGDRALLALQGPAAQAVLAAHVAEAADMRFMDVTVVSSAFGELWISRSGYTGEDGYEISVPASEAERFARALLEDTCVMSIGLGARDSLRLEAGLCLYGTDIDETTSPVEAALTWSIGKARRVGGMREGGFPGSERILREMAEGTQRLRVGLAPEGRAPMRAGTKILVGDEEVGEVTSGAFGPTVGAPVSMGYVASGHAATGTTLDGEVRGKRLPVRVADLPFVQAGFKR
ncbi:glycine cleavage system aminomethyltransferase GcvT [Ovoidimarina sediminis]